ncbi:MAG: CvpA family protein [Chloroflexi bacterium]|nr:CvpA family protein [Chloroflexota bacterium]
MTVFDWILLALIIIPVLWGLSKGAVTMTLTTAGIFVAMFLSGQFAERVVGSFTDSVDNEAITTAIGYVVIFLAVFIAIGFISRFIKIVLSVTMMGWLDKLLGVGVGVLAGVLLMTAATMVAARYAYVVDDDDGGGISGSAEKFIKEKGRERLSGWLVDSNLVPISLNVQDAIPGNFIGLVPGDFSDAMDELEKRRDQKE